MAFLASVFAEASPDRSEGSAKPARLCPPMPEPACPSSARDSGRPGSAGQPDEPERMPALIKAALAHVQFETIHPFLDGNGRLGRLLVTLLLCHEKMMREPLLYLSLYFKQNRQAYYDLLQHVRTDGDWESWLAFFVDAIQDTARQAVSTANRLSKIIQKDRNTVQTMGRISGSACRVFDLMAERPLLSNAGYARIGKISATHRIKLAGK